MRLALLLAVLTFSATGLPPRAPAELFRDPILCGYDAAESRTGAPAWVLRGIAFAESSYRLDPQHLDPLDVGRFGLHEAPAYREERTRLYGRYDARDPYDAAYIAGRLYVDALARLGSEDAAIAAHRQGVRGVREDGVAAWYVERVREAK